MQILYLSIAGFIIRLVFYRSKDKQNKVTPKQFIKEMLKHNEGFILKEESTITNYTIEFLEVKGMNLLHDKQHNTYLHFVSYVGNHHIATYTYISRVQFIFLIKNAIEELLSEQGFVLHCSANCVSGKAVLYLGSSGVGKTTISTMLGRNYPILADDEGYVKKEGKDYYFYQGPFLERSYTFDKTSKRYQISSVFILEQGDLCMVTKPKKEELNRIFVEALSSQSQTAEERTLLKAMTASIPFQKLIFTKREKELMNCILNHSPFNDPSGFDAK